MNLKLSPNLTSSGAVLIIETARNAEICRDISTLQAVLQPIWNDINLDPDFSGFELTLEAELLRIAGAFLSLYGFARNTKNFQARGKDLLTRAIDKFENLRLFDKAAEARVMLAFCYWNAGEVEECDALLDLVERDFGENLLHPVYLRICLNRLLAFYFNRDAKPAFEIIEKISRAIEFCPDARLKAMFHNQAGLFCALTGQFEKGEFHLLEAARTASAATNQTFVAINYTNLADLYRQKKDFSRAFAFIDRSIGLFKKLNHAGFLPHALDTKAQIFLEEKNLVLARETARRPSVSRSGSFRGLFRRRRPSERRTSS